MVENESLNIVWEHLIERNLTGSITAMEAYLSARRQQADSDRLFAIRTDFELMADYWKRGFKDPQLQTLFDNLLGRLYVLYANAAQSFSVGNSSFLSSVYLRLQLTVRDWSIQTLQESLEAFVSDVAMLELEPEYKRQEKRTAIYARHHQLMSEWFDNLWISTIWTEGQADAMEKILLSPTIDSRDQQLLVSGITIAGVNHFDFAKFRTLLHVYQSAHEETVRQRALVGWVFMLGSDIPLALYRNGLSQLYELLEDEAVCQELVELQQQIIFCINAEKDTQTIQHEIMPDLLKNNNFRVTRQGIEEIEETPLDDILHPDAEEKRMEQVEESFRRMQNMQKQGSDIYFGGFSQMKRFPFFRDSINWLVPFYMDHPGIAHIIEKFRSNRFLQSLMNVGPFCNSDKYSFVLAFSQVMEQIPLSMRDMLERGEASVGEILQEESRSAAYIRRTYLQDLYRFYRLFPYRSDFINPFEMGMSLFFANAVFSHSGLEAYINDVAAFLLKQKRIHEAAQVLYNCGEDRWDFRYYMMTGYLAQNYGYTFDFAEEDGAVGCFERALKLEPKNERAMSGYARALFSDLRYEDALAIYNELQDLHPDKKNYLLNRSVCLMRLSHYDEALKDLYRLNFESPDDENVSRVLAWTLTCDEKYEQAAKLYAALLADNPQPDDIQNYGYCLWFSGNIAEAADCFSRYLKESGEKPETIFENERELLRQKGITEPEKQMMLYML